MTLSNSFLQKCWNSWYESLLEHSGSLTNPLLNQTERKDIVKIEDAKERIKELQHYVNVYEDYEPQNVKQMAVKLYAELNNVNKVANKLNELGYRKDGKLLAGKRAKVKLNSNDVTKMILSEVEQEDQLHLIVKKILNKNRKRKGIVVRWKNYGRFLGEKWQIWRYKSCYYGNVNKYLSLDIEKI